MTQRFVGVDLGTHHVKVVVVTSGLRGVQVLKAYEEAVELGPEGGATLDAAVAVAIAVLQQHGLTGDAVGVALPGTAASYRLLEFPFSDARRIAQAISFEADGQFPTPLDELRYDHVLADGPGANGRALVVAVRDARARAVADAFAEAGVRLKVLTATPIGVAQAVEAAVRPIVDGDEDEARLPVTLVMDVGHRTTEFTAIGEKGPVMARSVRAGGREVTAALAKEYRMEPAQAEAAKLRDGFVPHRGLGEMSSRQMSSGRVVAGALEALVRELEHTRIWLRSSHGYEVTRVLVAGGGARLRGLPEYLAEQTEMAVELLGSEVASIVKAPERDWTTHVAALGTAIATARRPIIQLHEAVGGGSDNGWVQQRMSTLVGIGVAIMAFGALDTIAQVKALDAEHLARERELAAASQSVFGREITSASEIEALLEEVDGQDLSSLVPTRGALELLAVISAAAKPEDAGQAAAAGDGDAPATPGAPTATFNPAGAPPPSTEEPSDEAEGEEEERSLPPVTDPSKGILRDDELVFSMLEIRERKVELKASATRSSAQDRLAIKLAELGCLANISKGKVRDQNDRKVFQMTMDNTCFEQTGESEKEEG